MSATRAVATSEAGTRLHLVVCLGADFDRDYIPHLCRYYAPAVDSWIVLLHSNDCGAEGGRVIAEAGRAFESGLADASPDAVLHTRAWQGEFRPLAKVKRLNHAIREQVPPGEWVLHVDADEFVDSPGRLAPLVAQCCAGQQNVVYGRMIDRFARDGKPHPIRDEDDLFLAFPRCEEYTKTVMRGWTHRPCLMKYEGEPPLVNCHDYSGQSWSDYRESGRPVLTVWHFKWVESTREKLKHRVVSFRRMGVGWWKESTRCLRDFYGEETPGPRNAPGPWRPPRLGTVEESDGVRLRLGLVSETTPAFLNQVKLCLFSLRRNGGTFRRVPVTLITNSESLSDREAGFLREHFSPIDFVTSPRLGAIPHTSKLNVFYSIDPSTYDVLMFMDCDTVVRQPLDRIADPIVNGEAQFVCRRGGETDRNRFVDFDGLVTRFCGRGPKHRVLHEGLEEWPMFNSGVFLATSEAVRRIRRSSVEFTYQLFNEWQRNDALRRLPGEIRKQIRVEQQVLESWPIEQGALALACIEAGVRTRYLDEAYNSWGGDADFRVLHCFKSLYTFDRRSMFSDDAEKWIAEYLESDIPGKVFLASILRDYKRDVQA